MINHRIFATLYEPGNSVNIKLPLSEQTVFCAYDKGISPVPNKWGLQGWTTFELDKVPEELLFNALETAYFDVVNKK